MKLLILIVLFGVTHKGHTIGETLIVGMDNQLSFSGLNVTLECKIAINNTEGPKRSFEEVGLIWHFTPVGENISYIVLQEGVLNAGPLNNEVSGDGVDTIKYHRKVWIHLTVIHVDFKDAGKYTCSLADNMSQNATGELFVIDDVPQCTMPHEDKYYEGDNVTLGCSIDYHGNQPPTLDWHLPQLHIDKRNVTFVNDVTEYKASYNLQFSLQKMIDGNYFYCTAVFPNISKTFECERIKFAPESVLYAPFITHIKTYPDIEQQNPWAALGSNLTLYCFGHGNPTVAYTWEFTPVNGTKQYLACDKEVCRLLDLQYKDAGKYSCSVMNTIKGLLRHANYSIDLKILYVDPCMPNPCISGTCVEQPEGYMCNCEDGYKFTGRVCDVPSRTDTETIQPVEYKGAGMSPYAVGAVVCASLAIILIVAFIFLAMKMRSRERRLHQRLTRMHDENLDDQEVELLDESIQPDMSELPAEYGGLKQQWEIARKDIRLVDLIANGSFVEIWRGRMRKYPRRNEIMKVAIKRINAEATEKEKKFFLAELEVLKAIQPQQNILPLIGCYTASEPWLMMVELAVEGSLYQYLQQRRPGDLRVEIHTQLSESVSLKSQGLTAHKLLAMAAQIVNGLQYINRFKMIYYRLRAASVLVCKNGICKLSGFGFVQDITERNLYENNSSPTRWMSPESLLDNVYNVKTDTWQFGIVLWEIIHFGHLPYPDMGPHEVSEKIHTGYRMPQPSHCSGDIHNLMLMCWAQSPENRPCFGDIMQTLSHLSENATSHINIDRLPEGLKRSDILENSNAIL